MWIWMRNSRINFLIKIQIRCWDINKTRKGITFIWHTLYTQCNRCRAPQYLLRLLSDAAKVIMATFVISNAEQDQSTITNENSETWNNSMLSLVEIRRYNSYTMRAPVISLYKSLYSSPLCSHRYAAVYNIKIYSLHSI